MARRSRPRLTNAAKPATFEVEAYNERSEMVPTAIAGEHPLTLYLDKRELVTLMTLGHAPEALTIGYLRNQRLVESIRDIAAVQVDWETESVAVTTTGKKKGLLRKTRKRTVTTGCGQGTVFGDLMDEIDRLTLREDVRLADAQLFDWHFTHLAALLDDFLAHVALAEHGIAEDDAALDGQDAQQFEGGLMLVGLGIDTNLGEDGLVLMREGRHEVVAGRLAVAAAAQSFAVEGDGFLVGVLGWRRHSRGDPAGQGGLKGDGVEGAEEVGQARRGGSLAPAESQGVSQFEAVVTAELRDGGGAFAAAEHGQYGE